MKRIPVLLILLIVPLLAGCALLGGDDEMTPTIEVMIEPTAEGTPGPEPTPTIPANSGVVGLLKVGVKISVSSDLRSDRFGASNVTVRFIDEAGIVAGETTTDMDGRFRIALVPGTYRVEFDLPVYMIPDNPNPMVTVEDGEFPYVEFQYVIPLT